MIHQEILSKQAKLMQEAKTAEEAYLNTYQSDPTGALETLTQFVQHTGDRTTSEWRNFWMSLTSYFRDGFSTVPSTKQQCVPGSGNYQGCVSRLDPDCAEQGYSKDWYNRIVLDSNNKEHYHIPASALEPEQALLNQRKLERLNKRRRSLSASSPFSGSN